MIRSLIPGADMGDHLPSGRYVARIPNAYMQTHDGIVPFPAGESYGPGFPRATEVNGWRFAAQAHDTTNPATWEYDEDASGWVPYPPPCCGVSPVIYDHDGVLHRSDCGPGVGSQGYRFVRPDNTIATGDQTYGPFHGLFEYTQLADDLWIGQAAYDGGGVQVLTLEPHPLSAIYDWTLRQLELGDCRFIRANRDGDLVALAFTRPEGVMLMRLTMAELRALPPVVLPVPPDPTPIPPVPPDPPQPTPEPPGPQPEPSPDPQPTHKEHPVPETQIVALKGPGGKYGRADGPNTGPWGSLGTGWRGLLWDRDTPDDSCKFELTKPDAKHKLVHIQTRGLFGVDATSAHIAEQFYLKPDETDRGWAEQPVIYEGNLFGMLTGQVEYDVDPALGKFVSCAFVVVVL